MTACRLFADMIYGNEAVIDEFRRVRPDNWEMREDVQSEVEELWEQITDDNFTELSDYAGYKEDFFKLGGFGVEGIDYTADVDLEELAKLKP